MKEISLQGALSSIQDEKLFFLYLYGTNCSVCHALLPQVEEVLEDYPEIQRAKLNVHDVPEAAGEFSVFTIPVLLLYVEGKETIREARFVNMDSFAASIERITTLFKN
ncbi:thioredoxin family protein [Guptibacillus algicola]|uniref:thioredoxin family protein n=1 Tax=Guptibacillus algicola TaxID=225844 RepID=UPI001CD734A6|nr:thioredoxin family protein [Alkalihalobacillus algicola]MCA0987698.1 thioredoxin family protein [Alkalihalobacillus algicola]